MGTASDQLFRQAFLGLAMNPIMHAGMNLFLKNLISAILLCVALTLTMHAGTTLFLQNLVFIGDS